MTHSRLALLVVALALLPARAGAQEGLGSAVEGPGFAMNVAFAPGQTASSSAGATGATEGGATGASPSPSPSETSNPLGGGGFVVLGLLLGAFLLLRTKLLRRRP